MRSSISVFIAILFAVATPAAALADAAPADYAGLVASARRHAEAGENVAAFTDYAAAYRLAPENGAATTFLLDAVAKSVPVHVSAGAMSDLETAGGTVYSQSMSNGAVAEITTKDELAEAADPQNGWPFTRVAWFYRRAATSDEWVCYCAVRFQLPSDQGLAEAVGRVLDLLRTALVTRTGYKPLTDGAPFSVWLCRHATGTAGEQWRNNIYFYDVAGSRSSIEWLREIAHEYSHMALPILGGDYTDPEPWANGYYGERLLLRWIARGAAGGTLAMQQAWGATFSGYINLHRQLIVPALALFAKHGVSDEWLGRRDADGMTYLIGMILTVDDKAGAKACADLLWNLPQSALVDPRLLASGARDALSAAKVAGGT